MGRFKVKYLTRVMPLVLFGLLQTGNAAAQDNAGEVLQLLEKAPEFHERQPPASPPPVIEQEIRRPVQGEQVSTKRILVKRIEIEGNTLIDSSKFRPIVAPAEGKELTLEELRNVADLVTTVYRDEGYLLANAFVPSQSVNDGVVYIKVVEGRVGDVTVTGNKSYSSRFIERHLDKIKEDPSLIDESLERALLLLNDYPALGVKASLKAGKEPGTTDIIAVVNDRFPIGGSLGYDNFGESATSRNRLVAALDVGNLITSGDLVMLRGVMGLDKIDLEKLSYGRIEYMVPVGGSGTHIGAYGANSMFEAGDDVAVLALEGDAQVYGLYVEHPIIKKRDRSLSLKLSGEYVDVNQDLLGAEYSEDKIRKLVATGAYTSTDRFLGRNFLGFGYARGLGGFLNGSLGDEEPGTSREDADNQFNKFILDALRIQKLPGYNQLTLKGAAQYSWDRLFIAEQFLIGGYGTVRGFQPAALAGDSGYNISLELTSSPLFPEKTLFGQRIGDTFKVALFLDHGWVRNNRAQTGAGEIRSEGLVGVGAGFRLYLGRYFFFKLDWATPVVGDVPVDHSWTYLQASLNF